MSRLKFLSAYFFAPILAVFLFFVIFQIWKIDLTIPSFGYDTDATLFLFYIKNIIDSGWIFTNQYVGLPHLTEPFNIYDFPIQSDLFNLGIFKLFSLFTNNAALIANIFFILTFALIAATSFIVLRVFKISIFAATIISVIYAFMPYHMWRGVWHLFLSNYMIVPLSVMVALWISSDKISIFGKNQKGQFSANWNKFFFISAAIAIFAAMNGVYYAYYSCVLFVFAWFIRGFKQGKFLDKNTTEALILCGMTFITLICLFFPTFIYQMSHGSNLSVGGRSVWQSEYYALRIADLLMPITGHYIENFAQVRDLFNSLVMAGPERASASLGFAASWGFLFLLMWLIGKNFSQENSLLVRTIKRFSLDKNEQNLISDLAVLNFLSLLFASVGGLVMFISMRVPLIRSHCRFSIFIAFLALFLLAIIFDKIIEKKIGGKKIYAQILLFLVMILAVLDQTGREFYNRIHSPEAHKKYFSDRNFVAEIEKEMPSRSMIFILPVSKFPEVDRYQELVAYVNSKELRWSYPSMVGRESNDWQQRVSKLDFKKFIAELKAAGFAGIYIDRPQYREELNYKKLLEMEALLSAYSKAPPLVSENKQLVFFKI